MSETMNGASESMFSEQMTEPFEEVQDVQSSGHIRKQGKSLSHSNARQVASKWTKTEVLRQDPRVAQHIPETRFYSPATMLNMVHRYGKVVLKPTIGTGGIGVIMVSHDGGTYTVRHRRVVRQFSNQQALIRAVGSMKRKRSYLVQRGITLAAIGSRPIDYRMKVVKRNGRWETRSIVGRLAGRGLFVTNLCRGGTQLTSAEGIRRSLGSGYVRSKKNEMRTITRISTRLLERHFPGIGQLGFDYGFDQSGKMWIFEVNTRPH